MQIIVPALGVFKTVEFRCEYFTLRFAPVFNIDKSCIICVEQITYFLNIIYHDSAVSCNGSKHESIVIHLKVDIFARFYCGLPFGVLSNPVTKLDSHYWVSFVDLFDLFDVLLAFYVDKRNLAPLEPQYHKLLPFWMNINTRDRIILIVLSTFIIDRYKLISLLIKAIQSAILCAY